MIKGNWKLVGWSYTDRTLNIDNNSNKDVSNIQFMVIFWVKAYLQEL